MLDDVDNCPPSECLAHARPISDCKNSDQDDLDHDGIGDACDLCALSPTNDDLDHDGIGDACDLCPELSQLPGTFMSDADADGVGDACDNCPTTPNPYSDCFTCVTAEFPGTCIVSLGAQGSHCSRQLDDFDHDSVGNVCDGCLHHPADGLLGMQANSNVDAEGTFAPTLAALPDVCDDVPQYVARPNVIPFLEQDAPCGDAEPCHDSVRFYATASMGSVADSVPSRALPTSRLWAWTTTRSPGLVFTVPRRTRGAT